MVWKFYDETMLREKMVILDELRKKFRSCWRERG